MSKARVEFSHSRGRLLFRSSRIAPRGSRYRGISSIRDPRSGHARSEDPLEKKRGGGGGGGMKKDRRVRDKEEEEEEDGSGMADRAINRAIAH